MFVLLLVAGVFLAAAIVAIRHRHEARKQWMPTGLPDLVRWDESDSVPDESAPAPAVIPVRVDEPADLWVRAREDPEDPERYRRPAC